MRAALGLLLASGMAGCSGGSEAVVPSRVDTAPFDGRYELVADASFGKMRQEVEAEPDAQRKQTGQLLLARFAEQYANFRVSRGIVRSGERLVQEFSLTEGSLSGTTWRGKALWHEDIHDPGDANEVGVQLTLEGDRLEFAMLGENGEAGDPVVLRRAVP